MRACKGLLFPLLADIPRGGRGPIEERGKRGWVGGGGGRVSENVILERKYHPPGRDGGRAPVTGLGARVTSTRTPRACRAHACPVRPPTRSLSAFARGPDNAPVCAQRTHVTRRPTHIRARARARAHPSPLPPRVIPILMNESPRARVFPVTYLKPRRASHRHG